MKKVIALLWLSLAVLTAMGCLMIYSGSKHKGSGKVSDVMKTAHAVQSESVPTAPALPTVIPSIRSTRPEGAVNGLGTDFEQPSGRGELRSEAVSQVSDRTYDSEQESATGGEETDTYQFPDEMYPYRAMLTTEQQKVYDKVYASAAARTRSCVLGNIMISRDAVTDVMTAVYNDHPELFWLGSNYTYGYTSSGRITEIVMGFNDTANNYEASRNNFNKEVKVIVESASKLESDEEKERYVYNILMDSIEYKEDAPLNQSAYSALVNKSSVCAGYSRAFQYIMQQLNIPCYFCSGYANGGNHAWNIVKLGDYYVNVDISWDDSMGKLKGGYTYQYYNVKDAEFVVDHTRRGMSVKLPECR